MNDDDFMASLMPAAEAWHNLCAHADQLAELAAQADPTKMPVTSTYPYALAALNKAVENHAFHEVYDAVEQFAAAFDLTGGLMNVVAGGPARTSSRSSARYSSPSAPRTAWTRP